MSTPTSRQACREPQARATAASMPAASSSGKFASSWPVAGSIERSIPTSDIRTHDREQAWHDLAVARAPLKRTPAPAQPSSLPKPNVDGRRRVAIEAVSPEIDAGRFPARRSVGEKVAVEADIVADGQDALACVIRHRHDGQTDWTEVPMVPLGNDRWRAEFAVTELGRYRFTIEAWVDPFETWSRQFAKRVEAGQDVDQELEVAARLVEGTAARATGPDSEKLMAYTAQLRKGKAAATAALGSDLAVLMERHADRSLSVTYGRQVEVTVEPQGARYGAWYEMFPRSAGKQGRHGTFRDVEEWLPYISGMGFDVLYFPPIHPIGRTIALDLAFQCSPDHPYTREHPEWFRHRPDGSIQYAENPPKKYEDIYPFDFECEAWRELWAELLSIVVFWIDQGVKIFRVDNPHTKPFPFWEWLIGELKQDHPDVILLSEAFTRPKVMYRLAKSGFSQSYTYFAWRNTSWELSQYFTELRSSPVREFLRPNLWPNTTDILTEYLQNGGRPAFAARLVLAATLGASYGIYGPAFELGESRAKEPGSEEYLDSEKYQIRSWDRDSPSSLRELIAVVNKVRRENPALHSDNGLMFHPTENDQIVAYTKSTDDLADVVLTVVNVDPHHKQIGMVTLPLEALGIDRDRSYQAHELISGARYIWNGPRNYIELDPNSTPAQIFRFRRRVRSEHDFEYFL